MIVAPPRDPELRQCKRLIKGAARSNFALKSDRRERNFWMQRQGAKIITKKGECLQRPKSGKQVAGNPRRSALFGVDCGKGGLRRLDGGVRSHIRTGLGPELPDNCLFTGYF